MRRMVALIAILSGCAFDRDRPSPVEPDGEASLSVEVVAPLAGAVLGSGTGVTVEVSARDLTGDRLYGVGFVARRADAAGNAALDSAVESTGAQSQAVREFTFVVPAGLVNTQVDVFGLAFGPGTQSLMSSARSVTVVACAAGVPGC
ncbi:MAG TPA: hypothetical protein VMM79_00205 [Longimicrobiales bacterium]|nr:hypothetical protein [Longimicrobiales bacterium]